MNGTVIPVDGGWSLGGISSYAATLGDFMMKTSTEGE